MGPLEFLRHQKVVMHWYKYSNSYEMWKSLYITITSRLRFVNLFVEGSRVCAARSRACSAQLLFIEHSLLRQRVTSFVTIMILFTEVVASWLASGPGMMGWKNNEGAYISNAPSFSLEIPSILIFIVKILSKFSLEARVNSKNSPKALRQQEGSKHLLGH